MVYFNEYLNETDLADLKNKFVEKGKLIRFKKKDYFVLQNELCKYVGYIKSGAFKYTRTDNDDNDHIVGYSFAQDFVSDYPSFIKNSEALTSIQAITDCSVYLLTITEMNDFWETNIDTQRLGRLIAENMFVDIYNRLLGFYCDTTDQRYIALLKRCPTITQHITLKEIASLLGVTPETVSHIRKKLRNAQNS